MVGPAIPASAARAARSDSRKGVLRVAYFDFPAAGCSCNALNCACCASRGGTPSSSLSESEINVRL